MVPPYDDASDDELQVFDRIQHFPGAERSASFKRPKYKIDKPPMISRRERTFRIVWAQSMAQRCRSDVQLFLTVLHLADRMEWMRWMKSLMEFYLGLQLTLGSDFFNLLANNR
jgi:hypothetical protein